MLDVIDGPTPLIVSDVEERRRRRRLVQPAFALKRVDATRHGETASVGQRTAGLTRA